METVASLLKCIIIGLLDILTQVDFEVIQWFERGMKTK
jgi:hypothetical protein